MIGRPSPALRFTGTRKLKDGDFWWSGHDVIHDVIHYHCPEAMGRSLLSEFLGQKGNLLVIGGDTSMDD